MKSKTVVTYKENTSSINVEIKKSTLRYLTEFIRLKCAPDLLIEELFPNAKEITESMAAYNAIRKNLLGKYNLRDSHVDCIVVGDGCTPRTGALVAMRTNWIVYSIDPRLRVSEEIFGGHVAPHKGVNRLYLLNKKIEQLQNHMTYTNTHPLIVLCVHSHAKLSETVQAIKKVYTQKFALISMPCCVEDDLPYRQPDITYEDWGIHSEKRIINIYTEV